jgi:hypothetical protein
MKAGKRLGMVFGVAALMLAAAPARAQETPPAETPPAETIGPRELQNFSINGTVTREAEPAATRPAVTTPRPAPRQPAPEARVAPRPTEDPGPDTADRTPQSRPSTATLTPASPPAAAPQQRPSQSVTVPLPPIDSRISAPAADLAAPPASDERQLASGQLFTQWPWLLALLALGLGGLFLWRSRSRPAYADWSHGGEFVAPERDALVAPQPVPPPAARPAPQPAARPVPAPTPPGTAPLPQPPLGVVSTRLRPRLELQFNPLQCTVDGDKVIVDFELELFNSGSAPARAVLIEASLFNAGQSQDQAIGAFFDNPVGQGERIVSIAPLKRIAVRSQVVAPRANVQLFKVEDREVFVPLIAFNALYRWASGEGQTSSAYMVGRDTKSERLRPLRADLGAKQYRDLGARALPNEVRA